MTSVLKNRRLIKDVVVMSLKDFLLKFLTIEHNLYLILKFGHWSIFKKGDIKITLTSKKKISSRLLKKWVLDHIDDKNWALNLGVAKIRVKIGF